ncbi:MAG: type II secretion system protein [Planctomycetales bacterium]|nr:type II secretion system protein [Planctomycetales bacterium]
MKSRRSGFTLIEVLIVIVIMAVLAATIVPQFSSSTEDARATSIDFTLHTLKNQIQMYKAHHLDTLPATITAGDMPQLTAKTDKFGAVGTGATHVYGPYLLDGFPVNPVTNASTVVAATSASDAGLEDAGWGYNATTGEFYQGVNNTP